MLGIFSTLILFLLSFLFIVGPSSHSFSRVGFYLDYIVAILFFLILMIFLKLSFRSIAYHYSSIFNYSFLILFFSQFLLFFVWSNNDNQKKQINGRRQKHFDNGGNSYPVKENELVGSEFWDNIFAGNHLRPCSNLRMLLCLDRLHAT